MPPAPLTASALTGLVGVVGLVHLAIDPRPFGDDRALLVAGGMAILTLVVTTGLLLARGRWSRWALLGLGAGWLALALRSDLDALSTSIVAGAAAMIGAATGPWLPRWLRHRPAAEGPPPAAVIALLGLLAMPVVIGVTSANPGALEWAVAGWSVLMALGVSRAQEMALWAARILHPPLCVAAGVAIGLPWGTVVALFGAAQSALLWRRDVLLAVSPLIPEAAPAVPIPRELVDPAILRAAGLDPDGHRLEDT